MPVAAALPAVRPAARAALPAIWASNMATPGQQWKIMGGPTINCFFLNPNMESIIQQFGISWGYNCWIIYIYIEDNGILELLDNIFHIGMSYVPSWGYWG